MEENVSVGFKVWAEMCGGFLTWVGSVTIVAPLAWWATASIRLDEFNRHAAVVGIIAAPITYLITGLIERRRIA
jgi:hypothetical protein